VGGDVVSISTIRRLSFSDFSDMLVALLVALHRCLRRVSRVHALVQALMEQAQVGSSVTASAMQGSPDERVALLVLSRDVVVTACSTAQRQAAKLLKARRGAHTSLKVHQMGTLMVVCDAFAGACTNLSHEAAADSGGGTPSAVGGADAIGGSELCLEASLQVSTSMASLHKRYMTSLPALLDSEMWKAVPVQPTFHGLMLDMCVPGVLGGTALASPLPSLRHTLAAQPVELADQLAAHTLSRLGQAQESGGGADLLSAGGRGTPLVCSANWAQLLSAPEASAVKVTVHLRGNPSTQAASEATHELVQGGRLSCDSSTVAVGLVQQVPLPPVTKRLHVLSSPPAAVTVLDSTPDSAQVQVGVQPFTVVGSALMLLKMLDEYVTAARLMPHTVSGDAIVNMAELLRVRVCSERCLEFLTCSPSIFLFCRNSIRKPLNWF
jgi:hypothetical protein